MPQLKTNTYYSYPTNPMSSRSASPEVVPTYRRSVDFAASPAYSRLPRDDELFVMKAFARHSSHCGPCAHPYEAFRRGGSLCSRGHQRALDVAQYLYNQGGQAHSVIEREQGQRVHVEIPQRCDVVRELLKALERGLRLRRKVTPPSHSYSFSNDHDSYYTSSSSFSPRDHPPRTHERQKSTTSSSSSSSLREPRYISKPMLETTVVPPPNRYRQLRRDHTHYVNRDTLFERDFREKERRYRQRPVYTVNEDLRYPPPVPPKDSRWRR